MKKSRLQVNQWSRRIAVAACLVFTGLSQAQQTYAGGAVQVDGEVLTYADTGLQQASGSLLVGGLETRSSADLATGALKAYVSGGRPGDGMAVGSAGATFADSLWFNGASVGTYVGELRVSFEAMLTSDTGYEATFKGISALSNVAVATAPGNTQMRFVSTDCSAITLPCKEGGRVQEVFSLPLVITSTDFEGRGSILLSANLQATAVGGGIADAGHTLRLSLALLPEYQSYSSASGVFLTAVPEPSTLLMLLGGLLAVGVASRMACARRESVQADGHRTLLA
ncbi:PEP-CTERM sorting domain-containing protein [Roseateles sp.]|uniref:PEP-CTERM sorting domain-containing protein n=1 Tax=Roseateles sp. TaxID=1971397 RepID=UPI00326517CB